MGHRRRGGLGALLALSLFAAACGGDDTSSTGSATTAAGEAGGGTASSGELTPVKLQLQWVTQAQFAGYFAAVDQGYYEDLGLDVQIVEGGVDIVPQTQLASGAVDFALAWVPKALASREQGADIVDISQIFQRSGTLQVAWKDSDITTAADLKGKKVGNWGFGNEFELFAGMTEAGLDPAKDVTLVQQQFDMQALLKREIDAAQAMRYNEYAQVLEATDPETGELYQPEDLAVIDWNDEGTAMLQDAIWASAERLASDPAYEQTAVKFVAGSMKGWIYCRDNPEACADIVLSKGSQLGASHQLWQMNEINKLIWPSPDGIGHRDPEAWDRTVEIAQQTKNAEGATVLTKAPGDEAYNDEINAAALKLIEDEGLDTKGTDFEPIEVELKEGGS
jgi:NitT/TauT family transport system substrate-binding protein